KHMRQIKKLTHKQKLFLEVLGNNMGVVKLAVSKFGNMSRATHYRWMENPLYRKAVEDITEDCVDITEAKLIQKIQEGDNACIIFHLKTKGKHRGYVEKSEVVSSGELTLKR